MVTAVLDTAAIQNAGRRSREHRFFCGMSLLIALVVFVGFSRTYFLAGLFHAKPLPSPVVYVHGAVFTSWICLLLAQTSLAATGRTAIHKRLGIAGLTLASCIVVFGVLVASEMLRRTWNIPGFDARGIYAVALSQILGFAVPVSLAFHLRRKPPVHKRLILIGTIAMMTAGFGRWPVHFLLHKPLPAMMATFSLLLLVVIHDLLATRRIHRVTALGCTWVVFVELSAVAVGHTAAWERFAAAMRLLGS